jgi:small GTP-binding protein
MAILKHKICLLGAFAVGKTRLVQRFVNDRFSEKYLTTVGVSVSQKLMPPLHGLKSGDPVQHSFLIWDIAGLEKFDPVVMNYFRGASGALAVGDLTRPETIDDLATISDQFLSVNSNAALVTIANKCDLMENQAEAIPVFKKLAVDFESELVLTSAKTGARVETAFERLSREIERRHG